MIVDKNQYKYWNDFFKLHARHTLLNISADSYWWTEEYRNKSYL